MQSELSLFSYSSKTVLKQNNFFLRWFWHFLGEMFLYCMHRVYAIYLNNTLIKDKQETAPKKAVNGLHISIFMYSIINFTNILKNLSKWKQLWMALS